MLMKLIFAMCVLMAGFTVSAHAQQCPWCDTYKSATWTSPKPTTATLICLPFRQAKEDNVVVMLYRFGEDTPFRQYSKRAGREGQFCIGKQFVQEAGGILLCNGEVHAVLKPEHIQILLTNGGVPKGDYISLLGTKGAAP